MEQYEKSGFIVLPGFFSAAKDGPIQHAMDALLAALATDDGAGIAREKDSGAVRSIYGAHRLADAFKSLVSSPQLVEAARQIVGGAVSLHQSHVNVKQALVGKGYFWHQDWTFFHYLDGMPDTRMVGAAIYLTDNRPESGPLLVIPGSHLWHLQKPGIAKSFAAENSSVRHDFNAGLEASGLLTPDELRWLTASNSVVSLPGRAGDVLLYDGLLAHASTENFSEADRGLYLAFYTSVENRLINPTRPDYVAERHPKPL
ncbi:MAG: hypothetical protein HC841_01290 [Verrucomicrobiae bacterium]|nr:hypothetical protein [Verrucomicrobiae bacterium]